VRISALPTLLLTASSLLLAQAPASAPQAAQNAAQPPAPAKPAQTAAPLTIKAQAKLVVVDVVVTDHGKPVHDLKQSDFTLLEGGKPQTLNSFEEHKALTAADAAKYPPMPAMQPGVFTNYVPTPTNQAVNILLLDALNTPMQDQMYVRQQLLAYLKAARPGTNTAVFGLSTRLVMLQGFTANTELLKNVVTKSLSGASVLLDDQVGGGGMPDNASDANDANGGMMPADVVANVQTFMDIQQSFQLMLRARYTLDGMNVLARYLSSIPGRKNLIWFSGSFPLNILPDTIDGASDPFAAMADAEDEYRETTNLLARAQVAVYPIDARGLMTSPTMSAATSGAKYARNPRAMQNDEQKFFNSTVSEHDTMNRMADDTGGHAFFNTNGLTAAVDKAIEDGSNYYTITYSPTNTAWKGDFRKIKVQLAQQGLTLEYRHGYYADDPNSKTSAIDTDPLKTAVDAAGFSKDPGLIVKAMAHGSPGSSQILYKVRVLPIAGDPSADVAPGNILGDPKQSQAKPPYRMYSIDYAAVPNDIAYTITPDGVRHASFEFVAIVFQPDGVLVNRTSRSVNASITPEQFKRLQQIGIPFHQVISVPVKGDYSIRTAIHDLRTNRIGTTELNVAQVKNLTPLQPAPPPAPPAAPTPAPAATQPVTPAAPPPPQR
jgi:VWFA-related protein